METSGSDYILVGESDDHYWYYALGHVDKEKKVYGITEVRFAEEGYGNGFVRRGDHCKEGFPNNAFLEKRYVHLKFANENTKMDDLVKAIGLQDFGDEDDDNDDKIIASTGGSEMTYPFGTNNRFESYWDKESTKVVGTHWYAGGGLVKKNKFRPVYSTKKLSAEFNFGDGNTRGKISHPKKWGED